MLVDGAPTLSCITLVHRVEGREVTTIEGLRDHPMVDAFVRADARAVRLLHAGADRQRRRARRGTPEPSSDEIRHAMAGNLCRCGTYPKIEEAIRTWRD